MTVAAGPRRTVGTHRLLSGVGLTVLFATVIAVLVANIAGPSAQAPPRDELRIPAALAGSPLGTSVRGAAALAEVSRLHGKTIEAADAVVARYTDGTTVWISASPTALGASRLFWRMNRRMGGGTEVFSAPRPLEVGGRSVFVTEGLGQVHYYYQSGSRIIWLATPPGPRADAVLQAMLELYP